MSWSAAWKVAVNRSQLQPVGHSALLTLPGSQLLEQTTAPAIGWVPLVNWMTHLPRGVPQSASASQYSLHESFVPSPTHTYPAAHSEIEVQVSLSSPGTEMPRHAVPVRSVKSTSHAWVPGVQ